VKPAIAEFLAKRGLEFSEAKTRIVRLDEGFNFLGFVIKREKWNSRRNILSKRYRQRGNKPENVLTVKPQPKKTVALKRKIREAITKYRPFRGILKILNPLLRGWAEYFRISAHSTRIFRQIGHYVWFKMWKWARKKHHRKNHKWIDAKYLRKGGKRYWTFGITKKETLFDISTVTEKLIFPLKQGLNPYIQENKEYYLKRTEKPKLMSPSASAVYRKNGNTCAICGESLYNGEAVELHHIIPVKSGGNWTLENIQPLHKMCHASITNANKTQKDS
jgi:RNA-directed DNA polymerase